MDIQGLVVHMSGLHGEEEFHKERLKAFCRRCGNPFDQIQMKDIFLNLLQSLRRKSFKLTTWTLLVIMNILIHHFCVVAVLQKFKDLKKVRTEISPSFLEIKVNILFLKHTVKTF